MINIIKTICITHGFHPGEYTDSIAKALERDLLNGVYKIQRKKFLLKETGWGKALIGDQKRKFMKLSVTWTILTASKKTNPC